MRGGARRSHARRAPWGECGGHVWAPADDHRRCSRLAPDQAWRPRAPHSRTWPFFSSLLASGLRRVEWHEGPADGPKLLVDRGRAAALATPVFEHGRGLALPALAHASIEDDLHPLVARKGPADVLVELALLSRDDEEIPRGRPLLGGAAPWDLSAAAVGARLRQQVDEASQRAPRAAPARWARRSAQLEALVAVEAECQPSQRQVSPGRESSGSHGAA